MALKSNPKQYWVRQ